MAFYALFPRRKADGCGGQDSGDGGHGHNTLMRGEYRLYFSVLVEVDSEQMYPTYSGMGTGCNV